MVDESTANSHLRPKWPCRSTGVWPGARVGMTAESRSHAGLVPEKFGSQVSTALNWHSRYSGTRYSGTSLYVLQSTHDLLHTDHIMGGEVYFPF